VRHVPLLAHQPHSAIPVHEPQSLALVVHGSAARQSVVVQRHDEQLPLDGPVDVPSTQVLVSPHHPHG
jgi:hypothetical protein